MTRLTLPDRLDLAELVASYAAAVDTREWDRVAELFVEEGELVGPDPPRSLAPVVTARGREAIAAAMRPLVHFAATVHHLTGSVWSATGPDAAHGRTSGVAHHVETAGEEARSWVWHLAYDDDCVRTDEGWRFVRRLVTIRMIERRPVARVLLTGPPGG